MGHLFTCQTKNKREERRLIVLCNNNITLGVFTGISLLFCLSISAAIASPYPYRFRDSRGVEITIWGRPSRVVSLVPSITEIIFAIGVGDTVKGITYHTTFPPEANYRKIVGGFLFPSIKAINEIEPDVIFISRLHHEVISKFSNTHCLLIDLETNSISDSYKNILLLGRIFDREEQAKKIVQRINNELELIREKVARITTSRRRRVIRLMGRSRIMTPGDDSFQNEMIRAAGGIPPRLGKKGQIVPITRDEWVRFNSQVIFGCGDDRAAAMRLLDRPGWRDIEAVKRGRIFFFPCNLTCRAATNTGYFVQWLSARIYNDYFAKRENQVLDEKVLSSRPIMLPLPYVKEAKILYSHIYDFLNKTLIIEFKKPLSLVSTLEGQRDGIVCVGNHYFPPPCWNIIYARGLKKIRKRVCKVINSDEGTTSFLFTGADMDNLAIRHERFRDMEVYALVTAGVRSNALRMSADIGRYYELGTINIIILTNMKLTHRAMTRAIISATEAKTAALNDLDIRSSETPMLNQATGTGTDNIIVVQGEGVTIDNAGGHSKMGELIARAVYAGVQEAIFKQNGIIRKRNVFQRLKERKIDIFDLVSEGDYVKGIRKEDLVKALEEVLLDPRYSSFIEAALALSDSYEKGLVEDLREFNAWCKQVAQEIAGKKMKRMLNLVASKKLPVVVRMALNALVNGIYVGHLDHEKDTRNNTCMSAGLLYKCNSR